MNHIRQQAKSNEEGKSYLSNGNQASYTHWGALWELIHIIDQGGVSSSTLVIITNGG